PCLRSSSARALAASCRRFSDLLTVSPTFFLALRSRGYQAPDRRAARSDQEVRPAGAHGAALAAPHQACSIYFATSLACTSWARLRRTTRARRGANPARDVGRVRHQRAHLLVGGTELGGWSHRVGEEAGSRG